jgi:pilus assembly protein Flp/PilA
VPDLQRALFSTNHDVKEKDMNTMFNGIKQFAQEEDGAAGIEYALLLAFVALCMVAAGPAVKTAVTKIWTSIQTALTTAAG